MYLSQKLNINLLFLPLFIISLTTCQNEVSKTKVEHSFYYWRTTYQLDSLENQIIKTNKVKTLYIRYFDVDLSNKGDAIPVAPIKFLSKPETEVIPVVYITNNTLLSISENAIKMLASQIYNKVATMSKEESIQFNELQIDCDWSEKTKSKYFLLLKEIKKLLTKDIFLSATIRLHQIKFSEVTGIPPVDKGALMVYNVGKLSSFDTKNSIFDAGLIKKYIDKLDAYPLNLDVAFPVFNQLVIFRNKKFVNILRLENYIDLSTSTSFKNITQTNNYICKKDTTFGHISVFEGDILRTEQINQVSITEVSKQILEKLSKQDKFTYILFDLNSLHFKNSSNHVQAFFPEI